jgi:hypothetical protein
MFTRSMRLSLLAVAVAAVTVLPGTAHAAFSSCGGPTVAPGHVHAGSAYSWHTAWLNLTYPDAFAAGAQASFQNCASGHLSVEWSASLSDNDGDGVWAQMFFKTARGRTFTNPRYFYYKPGWAYAGAWGPQTHFDVTSGDYPVTVLFRFTKQETVNGGARVGQTHARCPVGGSGYSGGCSKGAGAGSL